MMNAIIYLANIYWASVYQDTMLDENPIPCPQVAHSYLNLYITQLLLLSLQACQVDSKLQFGFLCSIPTGIKFTFYAISRSNWLLMIFFVKMKMYRIVPDSRDFGVRQINIQNSPDV